MGMTTGKTFYLSAVCCGSLLLVGCVMSEKYEAEKARALNFQRLLAQEEKRTGEMDAEMKRLKREMPELEARNRELTAQLDAVREQMARLQEETEALREAAALQGERGPSSVVAAESQSPIRIQREHTEARCTSQRHGDQK